MKTRKNSPRRRPAGPDSRRAVAPARTTGPLVSGPGCITQEELHRYRALKAEQQRIDAEVGALRSSLIERLADEVPVEPGPYEARVSMFTQQVLTAGKLREVLAEEEIEDLKSRVGPTARVHLHVARRAGGDDPADEPATTAWSGTGPRPRRG